MVTKEQVEKERDQRLERLGLLLADNDPRNNQSRIDSVEFQVHLCNLALANLEGPTAIMAVAPDGTPIPGKHSWDLDDEDTAKGWTVAQYRLVRVK